MISEKYKNTLFVTDLDGTLITNDCEIPDRAAEHICLLTGAGVKITYSTARTYRTTDRILRGVPAPYPVALMNGVMIRNVKLGTNAEVCYIDRSVLPTVADIILSAGLSPFVYRYTDGELATCYAEIANTYMADFMDERIVKFGKPFMKVSSVASACAGGDVIYFALIDEEVRIKKAFEELKKTGSVGLACYKSHEADFWYLEVFSPDASKKNAVNELKRLAGADRLVCFGDNLNDLPMFEISDECYAPVTANGEVKRRADGLIPPPEDCGVTEKIAQLCGISLR